MPPEDSAQSELGSRADALEEAIEAIVYDVHPALASQPAYPYAGPSGASQAGEPRQPTILDVLTGIAGDGLLGLFHHFAREPDYVVPKRFGLSAILGIMTVVAMLFGGLHWMRAWPVFYLFFGVLVIAICLVQMFSGRAPRLASTIAGTIFLPGFVFVSLLFNPHIDSGDWLEVTVVLTSCLPAGALVGYLTGTCAAGIFLVMDALEPYLQGRRPLAVPATSPDSAAGA
jgi:hypothetical protein